MPPSLALFLWFVLLLGLLLFDPAKEPTSSALWVPVVWLFILASRLPSQWLGGQGGFSAERLEEGSPLDRAIFSVLILLAVGILVSRSFQWGAFFSRNAALTAFLSFALLSAIWSDFSFITFKRWFRDLGNYVVILVPLSDPRPLEAVRTLLRRVCYLLIPLSVVLVKYYPDLSRSYDNWTGIAYYSGATTSKNMLGILCLVSGLFFFWDTLTRWSDRKQGRTKQIIFVNVVLIYMTLWLLNMCDSATSRLCLTLGCLVIAAAHSKTFQRRPGFLKTLIPAGFFLYLILAFGFDINSKVAGAIGRDPTLTGRTDIWKILLSMHTNPLLGTGYESFWLGPRLAWVWEKYAPGLNEAHNGYLEVYLNLGLIGLLLLAGFLIATYRNICRRLKPFSSLASLSLALWTILLFYSVTEAGFRSGLMWVVFLMGAITVPGLARDRVSAVSASDSAGTVEPFSVLPIETTSARS
jgi:exopolysaccharide production protein ExoQ